MGEKTDESDTDSPWLSEGPCHCQDCQFNQYNSTTDITECHSNIQSSLSNAAKSASSIHSCSNYYNHNQQSIQLDARHLRFLLTSVTLFLLVGLTCSQQEWSPWRPPWENFDPNVVVRTYYGDVRGFSVPWHIEDEYWNPEWQEVPPWWTRRVNCFLGVPYAEPPVGWLRFQRPRRPRWGGTYDARYFRPACPQKLDEIRHDIPDFPRANVSEDCLYMNIFAPNMTKYIGTDVLFPVLVFIHGGDYLYGTSQIYPGHVLATKEVVVVTFNYRLGALGFLTLEDEHASGNWGLWDQHLALEFIKENIKAFQGDPDKITLMGEGAGAASVGLHIVSPLSREPGRYFHQAIMMSGSDLSPFGYVKPFWRPRQYAHELASMLGCGTKVDDSYQLMTCLRENRVNWQLIIEYQDKIKPIDGVLGRIWAPVQDGGFYHGEMRRQEEILPELPNDLRRQELFAKIPIIAGLEAQVGAKVANESVNGLCEGLFAQTFKDFTKTMLQDWRIRDIYRDRAYDLLEFQYTYWPDPENISARSQEFINMVSDYGYGAGIDSVMKYHAEYESSYLYKFEYKSWNDYLPWCMGVSYSAALPYVFGVPFMNETVLNETELVPRQWYDYEDRNISEFMMYMWTNFARERQPTPNMTWNVTWEPFNDFNLTYLIIDDLPNLWFRYRQQKYAFWDQFFPSVALQEYLYPTATPTPAGREYIYASGGMGAVLFLLLLILGVCIYLLVLQSRIEEEEEAYTESEAPLQMSRTQSASTVSRRSPYPYQMEYRSAYQSEV